MIQLAKPLEIKTRNLISAEAFRRAFSRIHDLFVRRKEGYGLSKNDFSDNYRIKLDSLENYRLPPATKKTLGGIIAGNGLDVDINGKLSVLFPDLSRYVTFMDLKKDSNQLDLRFKKIEQAAEQKDEDNTVFKNTALNRIGQCENRLTETNKAVKENLKRFDNYVTLTDHDTDISDVRERLEGKADVSVLNDFLKRKVKKSDLDGNLINMLDTITTEQARAAEDRENLRSVKTDIASLNNLRQLVQSNSQDINYLSQGMHNYVTEDALSSYVLSEPGKGLSERSFTNEDWERLQSLHNYTLPIANQINIGGVKAGDNVNISDDGTISVSVPTVKDFISKDDGKKVTDALDIRLTDCENKTAQQNNTLNTVSSSLSTTQNKVSSLESTVKSQAAAIDTLATKDDVSKKISSLDKNKVNVADFERHVAAKIGADKLSADINSKLDNTVTMSVDIGYLQKAVKSAETEMTRCFDRIKKLNSLITAIRTDIPDSKTYVRVLPGKSLSTNDFTDVLKNKLNNALTDSDIGVRVAGLNTDNKLDKKYLPDSQRNVVYVDDILLETNGSKDVLYFNLADKKIYYYDGANFQKTHDGLYNDDGVDLRTEMADLYVKKSEASETDEKVNALESRIVELEIKLGMREAPEPEQPAQDEPETP